MKIGVVRSTISNGVGLAYFYRAKQSSFPTVVLFAANNKKYYVMEMKPTKLQTLYDHKSVIGEHMFAFLTDLMKCKLSASELHMKILLSGKLPDYISAPKIYASFAKLHHYLMSIGLPESWIENNLGKLDEKEVDASVTAKFGKAKVIMPSSMQKSRKNYVISLLNETRGELAKKNFDYLITEGNIVVKKLAPRLLGQYIGKSTIQLNQEGKKLKDGVFTIIHELAHKLHNEIMDEKHRKQITEIYKKAAKGIDKDSLLKTMFRYPKDHKLANGNPWRVVYMKAKDPLSRGSGYYMSPFNGQGRPNGPHSINMITDLLEIGDSKWFVTTYARTDEHEMFAEMFTYWIMKKPLDKLPQAWMDTVMKKYQR